MCEKLTTLPESLIVLVGIGHWLIKVRAYSPAPPRSHGAFLNSYAPKDEGLYDDYPPR